MKRLLPLIGLFTLFCTTSFAQQGMGVGNNNPLEMLDVSGAIKIGNTTTTNVGTIRWNGTNFQGYNGSTWVNLDGGGADSDWTISGNDMYSAVSGNIGIGTTTPQFKLDIITWSGDQARIGAAEIGGWPNNVAYSMFGNQLLNHLLPGNYAIRQAQNGQTSVNAASGQYIGFHINNGEQMRLASNGMLGLGTNSPSQRLHVSGSIRMVDGNEAAGRIPVSSADGTMSWSDPGSIGNALDGAGLTFNGTSNAIDVDVDNSTVELASGTDQVRVKAEGITANEIATSAVTTDEILDGTILTDDIATGGVNSSDILDATILTEDIATGAVTSDEILDGTITTQDIGQNGAATGQVLQWNGSAWTPVGGSSLSDGDWTISGNNQYSAVTDNVGIGTTTPDAKLEVYDAGATTSMKITKDGSQESELYFVNGNNGTQGTTLGLNTAEHFVVQNNYSDKDIIFNVNDGGTQKDLIFIDASTARVGINLSSPQDKLHVSGATRITGGAKLNDGSASVPSYRFYNDGNTGMYAPDSDELGFTTGGSEAARIDDNGNIGIGTTSPSATLDVEGTFQLVDGTEGANKVLTSDASGNASWSNNAVMSTIPLWNSTTGTGYSMTNTSGTALSNCESGFIPSTFSATGNVQVKVVILVTSAGGTNSFQLKSGGSYPITVGDVWTWTTVPGGNMVVESEWKTWSAGTTPIELELFGWTSPGGHATFTSAYVLVKSN